MSLFAELSRLPRTAWVLFAGTVINRFGSFVLVFLMLFLKEHGFSPAQAGRVVGMYGLGALVAGVAGGYLADRAGRRATVSLSMFLSAAVMLAIPHFESGAALAALVCFAGFAAELYRPAASALLADLTLPGERLTAFALYRLAINLGFAVGPAVGGLLAQRSFHYLFVGDALTSIAYGILALVFFPRRVEEKTTAHAGTGIQVGLADARFIVFLLATLFLGLVFMQHVSTFPLQIVAYGLPPSVYGMLISLNGLVVLALELPLTRLTRRGRPPSVMSLGAVLVGTGFGLTAFFHTVPFLAMTVFVWTLGEIVFLPVAAAYVADLSPPHLRGRYQGIWGLSFSLAFVLAPIIGGALFVRSPKALWAACAAAGLASAMLVRLAPVREAPGPSAAVAGGEPNGRATP